ncbi:mucin-binding protein [Ligilactobacillus salivarius]|uniref:mucin-binding protein n=1 Tax=Ligilactobacillus salivarius TaxID=1624 RepID=UPI003F8CAF05
MAVITIDNLQGYDRSLLEQTFTRTINFKVPDGYEQPDPIEQSVTFVRRGEIKADDSFYFSPWKCKDNVLTEIKPPEIEGLKPSLSYVPSETINNPPKNVNEIKEHNSYVTVNYTLDDADEVANIVKAKRLSQRKEVSKQTSDDYSMLLGALNGDGSQEEKKQLLQSFNVNVDTLEKFLQEDSLRDDDKQVIAEIIDERRKQADETKETNNVENINQEDSQQADEETNEDVDESINENVNEAESNNEEVGAKADDKSSNETDSSTSKETEELKDDSKQPTVDGSQEEKNNKTENNTYDNNIVNEFSKATSRKLKNMISRPELIQPIPLSEEYRYLIQDMDIASVLRQLKIEGKIELVKNSWIVDLY